MANPLRASRAPSKGASPQARQSRILALCSMASDAFAVCGALETGFL